MAASIVIFGASGDLTRRKLIPALYELARKGRLPQPTRIVGFSRTPFAHPAWRDALAESTQRFLGARFDRQAWDAFAPSLFYQPGDIQRPEDYHKLGNSLGELEGPDGAVRVYYLATPPELYEPVIVHLGAAGLAEEGPAPRRLVVEKPFGVDRPSAARLNRVAHRVFAERQVYRIDHYLGKETVQNLLVFRFANAIFEPIWNRNYVEHVEITVAEALRVGHRGPYYDAAGVLRDMFQNHLLQLATLTAMEAPVRFEADAVRDEKVKVLRAIPPMLPEEVAIHTVRGQYRGYRSEPGVPPDSQTATFAAVRLGIDNWRWQGVPFYLRSGKAMSCPTTQIVIQFRRPPLVLFENAGQQTHDANRLVIQIQPAEGIQLHFQTKVPDAGMQVRLTDLNFRFQEKFGSGMPDAYQRLLLDVLAGDPSLFARADEVELAWGIIDPITAAWVDPGLPELALYEPGEWGPEQSRQWMLRQGRQWFDSCPVLG
ncbi:MAG: glucose-6-phosphate dehydrogenase [Thermoguttaceae bacterium]